MVKQFWVVAAVAMAGCELPPTKSDSGDSGLAHTGSPTTDTGTWSGSHSATTSTDSGGHTGSTPATGGWRALPLLDDDSGPDVIPHRGNSMVRGIHFTAPDRGVVATTGQHWTSANGQAVFSVDDREVTGIVFRGAGASSCSFDGNLFDVVGLSRTSDGYVVLTGACDWVVSHDDGASFDVRGLDFGAELMLGAQSDGGRTVIVRNAIGVSETTQNPGPSARWTDIWAPYAESRPLCAWGPQSRLTPVVPQTAWVSDDTQRMAYVEESYYGPVVCTSDDGGDTFRAHDVPTGTYAGPHGVVFTDDTDGITFYGNRVVDGDSWIYRTEDGGRTWTESTLPGSFRSASVEFRHAFFAPGGRVGWIVGEKNGSPLLVKTTDHGATWTETGGDLADVVSAAGGLRLYTGFALDEDHLWLGGEYGVLVANDAGGA